MNLFPAFTASHPKTASFLSIVYIKVSYKNLFRYFSHVKKYKIWRSLVVPQVNDSVLSLLWVWLLLRYGVQSLAWEFLYAADAAKKKKGMKLETHYPQPQEFFFFLIYLFIYLFLIVISPQEFLRECMMPMCLHSCPMGLRFGLHYISSFSNS